MGISIWQILLVVGVVILLFGAGRLPRLMGDMAKGIKSFKQGMREDVDADASSDRLEARDRAKSAEEKDRAANG
ncbi:MAG: twin-arginine translocase TatA/TatE family subunit [Alphaproteobacteria bacterium]